MSHPRRLIAVLCSSLFASLALSSGLVSTAQAGIFSKLKSEAHKVGDKVHDEGVTLGKEISHDGNTVVQEVVQNGKVVSHAVVKDGKIVEERTVQDGKEVSSEALNGGHFLVKDGKIVGREVVMEGKVVGQEVIKDGKVVGHMLTAFGSLATPIYMPGDFPPPAAKLVASARLAACKAAGEPTCYPTHQMPTEMGIPKNCLYGWSVGAGHPSSNSNPPDYEKTLNALDQCAWFHDRGAWKFNPVTQVCESWKMCSNSMGLKRCIDRFVPKNPAEAAAKECFTKYFQPLVDTCVSDFYKDWGAEFAVDSRGDQWLSAKSVAELRGALKKCPSEMNHPGFVGL